MWNLPSQTTVIEVGPRDGLQSLNKWIDTDTKVRMVDILSDAGLPVIEVTGFVSPRAIPNLADAGEVFAQIKRRPGTVYRALVPNAKGAQRAADAGVDEMTGLITASATYLKKNQNMTMEAALEQAVAAFRIADAADTPFVMAIGASMFCPYEGLIPEDTVYSIFSRLWDAGIRRYYLAGSLGMEDPVQVHRLFTTVTDRYPGIEVGYHPHNLSNWGSANVLAALSGGAAFLEGSICGIGGGVAMPTEMVGIGNLPTEDITALLNTIGIETQLDTETVVAAAREVARLLEIKAHSHVANAGTRDEIVARSRAAE